MAVTEKLRGIKPPEKDFLRCYKRKDGTSVPLIIRDAPLKDDDGRLTGMLSTVQDITPRIQLAPLLNDVDSMAFATIKSLPVCIFRKNLHGEITFANEHFCQLLKKDLEQIIGTTDFAHYPRELAEKYQACDRYVSATGDVYESIEEHQSGNQGGRYLVNVLKAPIRDHTGSVIGIHGMFWKYADREEVISKVTGAIRDAEARYRSIFENAVEGMFRSTPDGRYIMVNKALADMNGLSVAEMLTIEDIQQDVYYDSVDRDRFRLLMEHQERVEDFEYRLKVRNKPPIWVSETAWVMRDPATGAAIFYEGTIQNISKRKQEETLLRNEINHRVGNNLATISDLLQRAAKLAPDERSKALFRDSLNRVQAIAAIHAQLLHAQSVARIDMADLVRTLVERLGLTYGISSTRISRRIDVGTETLDLKQASKCALLISELVSNAFKHAFPNSRRGEVAVLLRRADNGLWTLRVSDTGIGGVPRMNDWDKTGSLGLNVVRQLARELGSLTSDSGPTGTAITVQFINDAPRHPSSTL